MYRIRNQILILSIVLVSIANTEQCNAENNKWSVETSIFSPIGNVVYLDLTYSIKLNENISAELLFGPCYQYWKTKNGQANGYSLILGFRLLYKEHFNFEYAFFPSYNPFKSSIDNKVYKGYDGFNEFFLGYRFNIMKGKIQINPQIGYAMALFRTNPWPEVYEEPWSPIIPNCVVSYRF